LFFKVKSSSEILEVLSRFDAVTDEELTLDNAQGRTLSQDLIAPENLPGFQRSARDGYAVKAKDTFGASENMPALLEVVGEIMMGQVPVIEVNNGQAVKIATGGMLPKGADGIVMVEYTHNLDEKTIEVLRAISPQEHVVAPDDDVRKGSLILKKGHTLRPQDLGLLAGLGLEKIKAFRKPRAAIISTGDEVIPLDQQPKPGQIRDINSYALAGFCEQWGAVPLKLGLCQDRFEALQARLAEGLDRADTVWISGGSSIGTRDWTLRVIESFKESEILAHGIAISPGKPTIVARIGSKAVFGLPGHPVSAMVVAEIFLTPFLARLGGWLAHWLSRRQTLRARLSRNVESTGGREDYIRVKVWRHDGEWIAEPIFGKSGLISMLVEADGLVKIERDQEGLYQGDQVEVVLSGPGRGGFA
jgi:molybdopterin molybdotransferase